MGFLDTVLRTGAALYPVAGGIAQGLNLRDERDRKLAEQARAEKRQAEQDLQMQLLNKSLIDQRNEPSDFQRFQQNPEDWAKFKAAGFPPDRSRSEFEDFIANPEKATAYEEMKAKLRAQYLPPSTWIGTDETGRIITADRRNIAQGATPLPGQGGEGNVYSNPSAGAQGKISDATALGQDVTDAIAALKAHPDAVGTRFALAKAGGTLTRPFGITPEKIAGKIDPNPENMRTRFLVTNVAGFIRNLRAGTALTGTEKVELEPFVPDVGEDYIQVMQKLEGLQNWAARRAQSYRRPSSDLPPGNTKATTPRRSAVDAAHEGGTTRMTATDYLRAQMNKQPK